MEIDEGGVKVIIPEMMNYELVGQVALEAVRTGGWFGDHSLHPDLVNPVLEKMREKLDNFKLEDGTLKIFMLDVDNFRFEEKMRKVLFAYDVKFRVVDSGAGRVSRYNNFVRPFISQHIKKLEAQVGKIKVRVTDFLFSGDIKRGDHWPRERF